MKLEPKYKVGIIGCGKILPRHIESINLNKDFCLQAVCDTNEKILNQVSLEQEKPGYIDYKEMISKEDLNFIVIATPNSLHFEQAKFCLENGCDVLIEKPVTLCIEKAKKIKKIAQTNNQKSYAVLQVRLNPVVQKIKQVLNKGLLGKIRGISLTQRWQRPIEYFQDWRGDPDVGGGTLHECGIHYVDVMCYLFGKPKVHSSMCYNTKHMDCKIEDTIYSLLNFNNFGGTLEVTIATEPKNIECSMSILTEYAYIELGGKALEKIVKVKFLDSKKEILEKYNKIMLKLDKHKETNSYGEYRGSCPNHPDLYSRLEEFDLSVSFDSLELIKEIYKKCDRKYEEK